MSQTFSGNYPLEHSTSEIERLHIQGEGMAPDTRTMLERIGVASGWPRTGRRPRRRSSLNLPSMSETFAGNYPLEHRAGEIERLRIQGEGMAPDALIMLNRIGVAPGWRCLDIGCGPRASPD